MEKACNYVDKDTNKCTIFDFDCDKRGENFDCEAKTKDLKKCRECNIYIKPRLLINEHCTRQYCTLCGRNLGVKR